jgi:hypothetical protein
VGTGTIPSANPACTDDPTGPTAGVRTFGKNTFDTYFARLAGINTYTASATATARFGYAGCSSTVESGGPTGSSPCAPIAFYVNWVGCDKSGKSIVQGPPSTEVASYLNNWLILPLCKTTGNWGWLNPDDLVSKSLPDWFDSETGRREDGNHMAWLKSIASDTDPPTILIPIYDCASQTYGVCPDPSDYSNETRLSNMFNCTGTNCYYHVVLMGAYELHAVYEGTAICTGQNSTECLWGKFTGFVSEGSILQPSPGFIPGAPHGKGGVRGIQLIK